MPLVSGTRVDRYIVAEHLGAGGMGEVYRAYDTRLERAVALKVLHAGSGSCAPHTHAALAKRILREARAAAALEHPNVVAMFDAGELPDTGSGATTFLAMELIDGKPLRAYVGDAATPLATKLRWLREIASALGAAHRAGLVHRDIKPENVMIRADGVAKVLDFGVAKRELPPADPLAPTGVQAPAPVTATDEGTVLGTPCYMAPEQMRGQPLDGRADQFAWGIVAYELLCGRRPWSDEGGVLQFVAWVMSHTPDPPDVRDPTIPRAVSRNAPVAPPPQTTGAAARTSLPPVPAVEPPQPTAPVRVGSRVALALAGIALAGLAIAGVRRWTRPAPIDELAALAGRGIDCAALHGCAELLAGIRAGIVVHDAAEDGAAAPDKIRIDLARASLRKILDNEAVLVGDVRLIPEARDEAHGEKGQLLGFRVLTVRPEGSSPRSGSRRRSARGGRRDRAEDAGDLS